MKIVQNRDIAYQEYDNETVLVDPEGSVCMVLNETASLVWKMCEEQAEVSDIVKRMLGEYEIDRETVEQDVQNILQEFITKGIVKEDL